MYCPNPFPAPENFWVVSQAPPFSHRGTAGKPDGSAHEAFLADVLALTGEQDDPLRPAVRNIPPSCGVFTASRTDSAPRSVEGPLEDRTEAQTGARRASPLGSASTSAPEPQHALAPSRRKQHTSECCRHRSERHTGRLPWIRSGPRRHLFLGKATSLHPGNRATVSRSAAPAPCHDEHALCCSRTRNRPCITFAFNQRGCAIGRGITKLMVELARPRPRIVRFVRQTFQGGIICLLIGFGRG
jgi:hypothetical protein